MATASSLDTIAGTLSYVLIILGLWIFYQCNGGSNGHNFVQRYFSIGWVVAIRIAVLVMLPVYVVIFVIQYVLLGINSEQTTILDVIASTIIDIFWVVWVARNISYVAKRSG